MLATAGGYIVGEEVKEEGGMRIEVRACEVGSRPGRMFVVSFVKLPVAVYVKRIEISLLFGIVTHCDGADREALKSHEIGENLPWKPQIPPMPDWN